jgi:carbon-monoxide dehydrogenase medium subunit
MKLPPFEYHASRTLQEALDLLATYGGEAAPLAGGQSLLPMMSLRTAAPAHIVDLNPIPDLDRIVEDAGSLKVGALVRHRTFERPAGDDNTARFLAAVARFVASPPIRTRGTFVGALAHADPAAEWCAVALLLDGTVTLEGSRGHRVIAATDFFRGPFRTSRAPDEVVTEAALRKLPPDVSTAFVEEARSVGDLPIVCAATSTQVVASSIRNARIAVGGIGPTPLRAIRCEKALEDVDVGDHNAIRAAADTVLEDSNPLPTPDASPDYQRHLGRVVVERSILRAIPHPA